MANARYSSQIRGSVGPGAARWSGAEYRFGVARSACL